MGLLMVSMAPKMAVDVLLQWLLTTIDNLEGKSLDMSIMRMHTSSYVCHEETHLSGKDRRLQSPSPTPDCPQQVSLEPSQ